MRGRNPFLALSATLRACAHPRVACQVEVLPETATRISGAEPGARALALFQSADGAGVLCRPSCTGCGCQYGDPVTHVSPRKLHELRSPAPC